MYVGKITRKDRIGQSVTMGEYNFKRVTSFRYLGVTISEDNSISDEVKMVCEPNPEGRISLG